MNVSSEVYYIKNNPSEVSSDLCKDAGVGVEQMLVSSLSISGYEGEVWFSTGVWTEW